jgi:outer membrane protein OmpA-like peptidoglycan-associated protein
VLRKVLIIAAAALLAEHAAAQPAGGRSADDFARAIQGAPCEDGQPRDSGGACPGAAEGATRGFQLLSPNSATKGAHAPAGVTGGPGHASGRHAPPPANPDSPLSDLRISFRLGSADVLPEGRDRARTFAEVVSRPQFAKTKFEIAGYTDASGSADRNLALSRARAAAVETLLIQDGVDPSRLTVSGYGAEGLLHPDKPLDPSNRRVEARLLN